MHALADFYEALGYPKSRWHIGPEHPSLETYAIRLLESLPNARVLEVGYQAGGFAVPIIVGLQHHPRFEYVGIDNLAYANAVNGDVIARFLQDQGVTAHYSFAVGDAQRFLRRLPPRPFDLVLIDHYKPLYPHGFLTILQRHLVRPGGYVLFHDVLGRARDVWKDCAVICRRYGCSWRVVAEIPEGLAVVTVPGEVPGWHWRPVVACEVVKVRTAMQLARLRLSRFRHAKERVP